jgi:hypothetical protein
MADEQVKKALEEGAALRAQSMSEFAERTKGKPTPTQNELDRIMLGEHILEKEDDGSGPDLGTRSVEAGRPAATYQTRQAQPARPAPPRTA